MSASQQPGGPDRASPGEVKAAQKLGQAQQAINRTLPGTLLKLVAGAGGAYLVYYMYQQSSKPLPEPVGDAVSTVVGAGGASWPSALCKQAKTRADSAKSESGARHGGVHHAHPCGVALCCAQPRRCHL